MMNHKHITTYDLVEQMDYLYIRIVKAKDLPAKEVSAGRSSSRFRRSSKDVTVSSCDPYAEVKQGSYKAVTRHFEKESNPEWNQVFAFWKSHIQDSEVEVAIMYKGEPMDAFIGQVLFDLSKVPKRVPPDTPLSPHWYKLQGREGDRVNGEVMVAVWWGTQADEAFAEAWLSDAPAAKCQADVRPKMYLSPKLWYLRVYIIEAHDLVLSNKQKAVVFVKATIGNRTLETKTFNMSNSTTASWNENLMFVVAEPIEVPLVLSVLENVAPKKDEVLGRCLIPLECAVQRSDSRNINTRWFKLEKDVAADGESRIHTMICLEGGYHVLDESPNYCSDYQPTDEHLRRSCIGVLEVGILKARGLVPLKRKDGRATTDAYCVAKYGHVWSRTRTIGDTCSPNWNEQYAWEVFDLNTVVTVGVFDNCHFLGGNNMDSTIGKVRIRVSTLDSDRVYSRPYRLLVLHPSGVKEMGEIELAVRFICSSMLKMMHNYSQPLFPEMHYSHPLTVSQVDLLRFDATKIVSMKLSRVEPPLRKEVVKYMLDVDSDKWSLRKTKANFFRIMCVIYEFVAIWKLFGDVCSWKNPITTILIHILFVIYVMYPQCILPSIFLYLFLGRVLCYRRRPRYPPHMDTLLSQVNNMHPAELEEEFDTFPTSRPADIVRMRYDHARAFSGRLQTVFGDLATQGERIHSLLAWIDPRSTTLFTIICLVAAIVLYITPFQVVALLTGLYLLRHPRFRGKQGSVLLNFFRRLPVRTDQMM